MPAFGPVPAQGNVPALVLFGDVIRSRREPIAATEWLRVLTADLAGAYADGDILAPFEFTQGDEIQGLLALSADYGVDELVVVTITHDPKARLRSYELLAEAFGLPGGLP